MRAFISATSIMFVTFRPSCRRILSHIGPVARCLNAATCTGSRFGDSYSVPVDLEDRFAGLYSGPSKPGPSGGSRKPASPILPRLRLVLLLPLLHPMFLIFEHRCLSSGRAATIPQ